MEIPDLVKLIKAFGQLQASTCSRCRKAVPPEGDRICWNVQAFFGRPVGWVCPDCQSPAERAEAVIREVTSFYTLENGKLIQHLKQFDDDDLDEQDGQGDTDEGKSA